MKLLELLNYQISTNNRWDVGQDYAEYQFKTSTGTEYIIYLTRMDESSLEDLTNSYSMNLDVVGSVWLAEFGQVGSQGTRYDITGAGNATEVLGHVSAALRMFLRNRQSAAVFFTAEEPSRRRLYDAITKRLGRSIQINTSRFGKTRGYLVT
jgi:hypothetical protein